MLLSISLKNWKSFEEKTTFTMEASKEQRHRDTLADFKKFRLKLPPSLVRTPQVSPIL